MIHVLVFFSLEYISTKNFFISIKRSPNRFDFTHFIKGGDVNAKDQSWLTPLHRAAASRNKVLSVYYIRYILL